MFITSLLFGFKPEDITTPSRFVLFIATEIASAIEVAPSYKDALSLSSVYPFAFVYVIKVRAC